MQLGSWTLNHNKHFFLTELCSENRGRVGWSNKGEWEGWANMFDVTKWEQTRGKYKYKADSLDSVVTAAGDNWQNFDSENASFLKILYTEIIGFIRPSQINSDSSISIFGDMKIHHEGLPSRHEELVEWARQKFGGVTSFTTIRNLRTVTLTGANGERRLCNTLSTHSTLHLNYVTAGGFVCLPPSFQPCHYGFCLNYETCIFVLA